MKTNKTMTKCLEKIRHLCLKVGHFRLTDTNFAEIRGEFTVAHQQSTVIQAPIPDAWPGQSSRKVREGEPGQKCRKSRRERPAPARARAGCPCYSGRDAHATSDRATFDPAAPGGAGFHSYVLRPKTSCLLMPLAACGTLVRRREAREAGVRQAAPLQPGRRSGEICRGHWQRAGGRTESKQGY
jgi:hypothetical protein